MPMIAAVVKSSKLSKTWRSNSADASNRVPSCAAERNRANSSMLVLAHSSRPDYLRPACISLQSRPESMGVRSFQLDVTSCRRSPLPYPRLIFSLALFLTLHSARADEEPDKKPAELMSAE